MVLVSSEKAMAPHSSTLAWKIPWMEEPGRLPIAAVSGCHKIQWLKTANLLFYISVGQSLTVVSLS